MQATNRITKIVVALAIALVAATLIGAAAWHPSKEAVQAPMIAVPTGEYDNGAPVYRLPSITVTVSRRDALAKMAVEDSLAMK
jgi:hypothetical protein